MKLNDIDLTFEQLAAVEMIKNNQICVLTGGPGTGKTTTVLKVIEWAKSEYLNITQAAPTGKAAKRMTEATGIYASTIHTMLECMFEDGKFRFKFNLLNKIPTDLIILDEISMITNDLMARVLESIDINHTKLLLIGDQDQLPSVGAGAVLRDILGSGTIPHVELSKPQRNTGVIVEVCHKIKAGESYDPYSILDLKAENPVNLIHVECSTPEQTLAGIEKIATELIPKKYGYDPVNEVQIISPVNSKGILSCDSINNLLKDKLNPLVTGKVFNPEDENYKFRAGDRVINTKNNKTKTVDGENTLIVNGDIGIVDSVMRKHLDITFTDPERKVRILKSEQNLLHAYCITCHRFQGSEAPVIIIPVHKQFNYFLSNAWIYTAISRAQHICITVGSFGTIERAIANRQPNKRVTMLKDRLIETDRLIMEEEFLEI